MAPSRTFLQSRTKNTRRMAWTTGTSRTNVSSASRAATLAAVPSPASQHTTGPSGKFIWQCFDFTEFAKDQDLAKYEGQGQLQSEEWSLGPW